MVNFGYVARLSGALWRYLDGFRKALHLVLLLGIVLIVIASLAREQPQVPESAALEIAPQGALVDQLSGDPFERALARVRGLPLEETLLKDLVDAIRAAADDERIKALVLRLDGLTGAGLSKLQELAKELSAFKESGKPVIALGDGFTRNQYYLAVQSDEIYMHPMGYVFIDGYSRFIPYFKSALDKLYVDFNVWTVGEYKSFVEPITRDDMSAEDREASEALLSALWESYQGEVTEARELPGEALQRYADNAVELLRGTQGDAGALALSYGLIDELLTHDLMRERLIEVVGEDRREEGDYARIGHEAYLRAMRGTLAQPDREEKIGVVVASGTILDGVQPPGTVGGTSTAQLIHRAREDEQVKALVLRVDSPGGSAFASDVILRELELFRESGRPLVVSMGSVAASGGYWISMAADEIWASPTTITGSIGVGATLPSFPRTLDWLGIHVDGLGTTELAGQFEPARPLGDDARELVRESVNYIYDQFVGKVAEHRQRAVEDIDAVARGRVWVGTDALERGLVDELGGFDEALDSAAELARLEEGAYRIQYFERELGFAERIALEFARVLAPLGRVLGFEMPPALGWLDAAAKPFRLFEQLNDPRGLYAYCFCDIR